MIIGQSEIVQYITVDCSILYHHVLLAPSSEVSFRKQKENSGYVGRFKP